MKCVLTSSFGEKESIMGNHVCLEGTRLTVYFLLMLIDAGRSNEEIINSYPILKDKVESLAFLRILFNDIKGQF